MIIAENTIINEINAPVREIRARVELYNGSTLIQVFKYTDKLKSFTIERIGDESKFFGYGICQKLNLKLIDKERLLDIDTSNHFEVVLGVESDYVYTFPAFYVSEVNRDENTNELSITAYDALYKASEYTVSDLTITDTYSLEYFARICATFLGLPLNVDAALTASFSTIYPQGANIEGSEKIRDILNSIAEATQTIYYINSKWELTFKRLDMDGAAVYTIDKSKYYSLDSKTNRRLGVLAHITELGDNLTAADNSIIGTTQYIRNNPFWELRDDIAELLNAAYANVKGLTINQFNCSWRGNFLLELGDKIALITKDDKTVYSYLLNDTLEYNGFLSQVSQWNYNSGDTNTDSNATSIGEVIKHTTARVDKANKEIELLVSETSENKSNISSLVLNTNSIAATVKEVSDNTANALDTINNDIAQLNSKVSATMTADDIRLEIQNERANGADKVITSTGFTFDENGLMVEKSTSEMKTQITEDGMKVYKGEDEMLVANNEGVVAVNLHATTFLILGDKSRFEKYGENRMGCYWLGESE